jgi:Domain of unknown function (DUF1929)/Carboxypeptidase regulatory-like domain
MPQDALTRTGTPNKASVRAATRLPKILGAAGLAALIVASCGDDSDTAASSSAGTGGMTTSSSTTTGGGNGGQGGQGGTAMPCESDDVGVTGEVNDGAAPATSIPGARVTLVGDAPVSFRETRSDGGGRYTFLDVPAGQYRIGASARGREYVETGVTVSTGCAEVDFPLGPETHLGLWETLGDPGEAFGGTNSGVLLPDGRLMYCHDTLDPVILDPVTEERTFPGGSPMLQGCHAVTVMSDGRVIYVGGHDIPVFGPGTRQVKTFDPESLTWQVQPDLNDYRWYPTMVPLPDGELLTVGGGGLNNPVRVNTAEVMDPATMTWSPVGEIAIGNEVSPIVMLYTGKALMTHRPPQLYDPGTQTWSLAGDFVQGDRTPNGDHADHEMILLPDGKVVAIGFKTFEPGNYGNLVEIYDPDSDSWQLGASFAPIRSRASAVLLPDQRILVAGGFKEEISDPTPVNAWGQVALTDLYDAATDSWRRLDEMELGREYHAMPILVPDGRVFITGGEGAPGNEPDQSVIEAFYPPYLFRGPRPEILDFAEDTFQRGQSFTLRVANTSAPTSVIMMGTIATTHFMDSGNGRYLELEFTQAGDQITATVPADPLRSMYGYYTLFVMVDDIPSIGRVVRIVP